ncbi:MAG: TldD/PmbA family protein [Pseudomonadota bacterium]|nr:TldD/PmbA family protein [Pseudomonadota bacterium]
MTKPIDQLDLLANLLDMAKKKGADSADAVIFDAVSIDVAQRLGAKEKLERSESADLGLRVFIGKKQAIVSSTDHSRESLDEIVERAVAMAKVAPEDPWCGIAAPDQICRSFAEMDSFDPNEPDTQHLIDMASEAEDAARSVKGVTNSEGAEAGYSKARIGIAATNGFAEQYAVTSQSLSVSVLAGEGTKMERDYDFATAVYGEDLKPASELGLCAGKRAVARLNPQKKKTSNLPVIYDWRVSASLLRHLTGAINGAGIARGTSFLKEKLGKQVFNKKITIYDDPHRKRGISSKPFDGEGIETRPKAIIKEGKLTTWLLDLASARQLGLSTTGNAARGTGGPPSPSSTNIYMEPGDVSVRELISDIKEGFFVNELIGMGVNGVTGDYSRGASGFWIENGETTCPVSEMTIAGNLNDMFANLIPANDLEFRYGTDAPTIRIDGMTVAGL